MFLKLVAHDDLSRTTFVRARCSVLGLDHDSLARWAGYHHAELYGLWPHRSLACLWGAPARWTCGLSALTGYEGGPAYAPAATIWTTPVA